MSSNEAPFVLDCNPSKLLDFEIKDGAEPAESVLNLENSTAGAVAFKVKTTKPKRYLVRPNQGVIASHETLKISIVLLAQDKMSLLHQYRQTGTSSDTNKFMVQALPLAIAPDPRTASAQTVSSELWDVEKDKVQQKKLVVRFVFPSTTPGTSYESLGSGNLDQTKEEVRKGIASSPPPPSNVPRGAARDEGGEMSKERMWEQARELRLKYDDLVSFTINLTAEKDYIQRSLTSTKEELQREQQSRKQLEVSMMEPGTRRAASVKGVTNSKDNNGGFSLFFVLVIALISMLLGQWTASRYPIFGG